MNVLVVEPGIAPYEKEINGLDDMNKIVGGTITAIYPFQEQVGIVCNDDARYLNMEFNRSVPGGYGGVFGPFFVCGLGKEEFTTLPPDLMQKFKKYFHNAEILLGSIGNTPFTLKVEPKRHPSTPKQKKKPPTPER